ncbi:MAG: metallophosphoesterase [Clostridiales Family XIII bacterium]|jgi:predicted phosphohydrolase|nr:metallophosphoesterase [Clostridiales Family XIII bacterium]
MNKIFALGDLHLSFTSEKPMDIFGSAWRDHEAHIRSNWLDSVDCEDTVYLLGDHSWALKFDDALTDLNWIHELPGRKVMLRGNHDLWWGSISRLRDLYEDMSFIQNDSIRIGDVALCGTRGWITPGDQNFKESDDRHIYDRELIRFRMSLDAAVRTGAREIVAGLHFPPSAGHGTGSGFIDLIEQYGVSKVVYGHLHGREAFKKGLQGEHNGTEYFLASGDYLAFKPLLISGFQD